MRPYQHIGVAVAPSSDLRPLLAEAAAKAGYFGNRLSLIHLGVPKEEEEQDEQRLRHVLPEMDLSADTPIHRAEMSAEAILRAIRQHDIDLLIAEAFDDRRSLRHRPGRLARALFREAPCSLLLLTEPRMPPEPIRRIVTVTDDSEHALRALRKVIRFAEHEHAEHLYVLRVLPKTGEAALLTGDSQPPGAFPTPVFEAEDALLHDLVDAAGYSTVPLEPVCLTGPTGFTPIHFAHIKKADLLAMPPPGPLARYGEHFFPSEMAWSLPEVPCTLWVMHEDTN